MGQLVLLAALLAADAAHALLERAIRAAGGARAGKQAAAFIWDGQATVHVPDRELKIAGTWRLEPPDRDIVETYRVDQRPTTSRTMIISGANGWSENAGTKTPLAPELVSHERDQFYLYFLLRLAPLTAPEYVLESLPADAQGHPGFRVKRAGRPTVDMFFDTAHRPIRLVCEVTDPGSTQTRRQEMTLSGDLEAGGLRWPRELSITWDGRPYFDLTVSNLRVLPRLEDARFADPPPSP